MRSLLRKLQAFQVDRKGATAVEYGLIMALMTVALIGALGATGSSTEDKWDGVADQIETAADNAG